MIKVKSSKYPIASALHLTFRLFAVLMLLFIVAACFNPVSTHAASTDNTTIKITSDSGNHYLNLVADQYDYSIQLDHTQTVRITLTAAEGSVISDCCGNSSTTVFAADYTVNSDRIISIVISYGKQQLTYSIHFQINGISSSSSNTTSNITSSNNEENAEAPNADISANGSISNTEANQTNGNETADNLPTEENNNSPSENINKTENSNDTADCTHIIMFINSPFMFVNDALINLDTTPYLVTDSSGGGYTMVPIRFIAEACEADVTWDAVNRMVGIHLQEKDLQLLIDQPVPGTPVAARIRDSRTFVPLRYVMESFGAQVLWSQNDQRIDIFYYQ